MNRVLVAVKRVVDYQQKVRVANNAVVIENIKMSMNPFCEIAVEEAVRMKQAKTTKEVVAVTIGPKQAQETLRSALAMGADRGIHIMTDKRVDTEVQPLAVAKLLKHIVDQETPDMVLVGKQSIDGDNNQTAQMLSGLLDWPQGCFASEVKVDGSEATVTREVDGGLQTIKMPLPAVVSADLRLNVPRYIKLPDIVKARKKKIDTINMDDIGVDTASRVSVESVVEPAERQGGGRAEDVDELIAKLKEAGVV